MPRYTVYSILAVGTLSTILSAGCGETPAPAKKAESTDKGRKKEAGHKHDEHEHASTGPHGGPIIELGKEDYHAELVHDDAAGTVTIYLLDSHAKKPVPIAAETVVINVKHDGKGEQFQLPAAPQEGDGEGKSSRFVSKDKELAEDLDHKGTDARLVVEIDGKPFSGKIASGHDGHDHSHEKK